MTKLDELGITYRQITGAQTGAKRAESVRMYNEDRIKVLVITKAGGEGLDLKNTTGVILMEPAWNESANQQVIGRAVRYKSHETLPDALRLVDIYRLYMIKPTEQVLFQQALLENRKNKSKTTLEFKIHLVLYKFLMK